MPCDICQDLGFNLVDGKRVPCACVRLAKLRSYYPHLNYGKINKTSYENALSAYKPLSEVGLSNVFFVADLPEEVINLVILLRLLSVGSPSYKILNSYELVEIFLEHHTEYKSFLDIRYDFLVVLHGYHEFENKRQEDFLLQLFDHYKRMQKPLMFVSRTNFDRSSMLYRYVIDNSWVVQHSKERQMGSPYLK